MRRGGCGVWGDDTHVITTLQNGPGVVASGRILVFTTHTDSSSYQCEVLVIHLASCHHFHGKQP